MCHFFHVIRGGGTEQNLIHIETEFFHASISLVDGGIAGKLRRAHEHCGIFHAVENLFPDIQHVIVNFFIAADGTENEIVASGAGRVLRLGNIFAQGVTEIARLVQKFFAEKFVVLARRVDNFVRDKIIDSLQAGGIRVTDAADDNRRGLVSERWQFISFAVPNQIYQNFNAVAVNFFSQFSVTHFVNVNEVFNIFLEKAGVNVGDFAEAVAGDFKFRLVVRGNHAETNREGVVFAEIWNDVADADSAFARGKFGVGLNIFYQILELEMRRR